MGAFVVLGSVAFLIPIFVDPDQQGELALRNGPLMAAYLVVAGSLISASANRHFSKTLRWLVEGRTPDEREHRLTLGLAVNGVKLRAGGSSEDSSSWC